MERGTTTFFYAPLCYHFNLVWPFGPFRDDPRGGSKTLSPALTQVRMAKAAQDSILTRLRNVVQASSIAGVAFGTFANAAEKAQAKRACYQLLEGMGTELPTDLSAVLAAA